MADIQSQLRQAITAARSGDRATAMNLLQSVIEQDSENETAWMWMATIATSTPEKRRYLQRVLRINPNNQTAQTALDKLGGTSGGSSTRAAAGALTGARRSVISALIVGAGLLTVAAITVIIIRAVSQPAGASSAELTQVAVAAQTEFNETQIPTTPAQTARPSRTPTLAGVIVSPNAATLPPTFTPTDAPTSTATLPPSPTPPPLREYTIFYNSITAGDLLPALYSVNGAGADETQYALLSNEAIISPDGQRVAFLALSVRDDAAPPPTETATPSPTTPAPVETEEAGATEEAAVLITEDSAPEPEIEDTEPVGDPLAIFVAPIDDLEAVEQLTTVSTDNIGGLSWSPTSDVILFVRDDVFLESVSLDGNIEQYIPDDTSVKRDPVWTPDGNRIIYASDLASPGLLEIFAVDLETGSVEQLTNDAGVSVSPSVSPDGTLIAFISDRNSDADLFIMNADGSSERSLTPDDGGAVDQSPVFSPDGRWVAFSSTRDSTTFQIFLLNVQDLTIEQVTDDAQNNLNPSFRP